MAYRAPSPPLTRSKTILIHAENSEEILITIKQRFDWLRQRYSINIDGKTLDFRTLSFRSSQYQCLTYEGLYEMIAGKGRKYSVTKNYMQVAWWDKNLFTISRGDVYMIEADRNANALLLIAFCLIIDTIDEKSKLFFADPRNLAGVCRPSTRIGDRKLRNLTAAYQMTTVIYCFGYDEMADFVR